MENKVWDNISHVILCIQQEQKVQKRLMRWIQPHSKSELHSLSGKIVCYCCCCCCRWTRTKTETEKDGYKVSVVDTLSLNQNYLSLMCSHMTGKFKTQKPGALPDLALKLKCYIYIEYFMAILFLRLDGKDHNFSPSDLELTGNPITTHTANIYSNL